MEEADENIDNDAQIDCVTKKADLPLLEEVKEEIKTENEEEIAVINSECVLPHFHTFEEDKTEIKLVEIMRKDVEKAQTSGGVLEGNIPKFQMCEEDSFKTKSNLGKSMRKANKKTQNSHTSRHLSHSHRSEISSHRVFDNELSRNILDTTQELSHIRCHNRKNFSDSSLSEHLNLLHKDDERPYTCEECHKSFLKRCVLVKHMWVHSRELSFECDICKKRFRSKYYVKEHMRIHMGECFKCDVCEKEFVRKSNLNRHRHTHRCRKYHLHKQTHTYKCNLCNDSFSRKGKLLEHYSLHANNLK